MDVILKDQAEKFANELAAQVTTLDDLNGLMRLVPFDGDSRTPSDSGIQLRED